MALRPEPFGTVDLFHLLMPVIPKPMLSPGLSSKEEEKQIRVPSCCQIPFVSLQMFSPLVQVTNVSSLEWRVGLEPLRADWVLIMAGPAAGSPIHSLPGDVS